jgi:signal transduction histidine kinase/DNA-binding NarL/FixJ family response regulator
MKQSLDILVVEDNQSDVQLLQRMLGKSDSARYHLSHADRLASGLEYLQTDKFDAVLLDLSLPDGHGIETFRSIQKQAPHLPIVVLTGLDDEEVALTALQEGAQDYLLKDWLERKLFDRSISYAIKRKKSEEDRVLLLREQMAVQETAPREENEALLIEASAILGSSLDYEGMLEQLARMIVPKKADICVIDVMQETGAILQTTVASTDPVKEAIIYELSRREQKSAEQLNPVRKILWSQDIVFFPEIHDTILQRIARDDESLGLYRSLNIVSIIAVPILARGQAVGAVTLMTGDSGRSYNHLDLKMAEELARLAALAVDNSRLYLEVKKVSRLRDEFLSSAAHELKTPITSLQGFTQMLLRQIDRDGTLDPHRVEQALRTIEQQSIKLTYLVSQLLDISRLEAGHLILARREIDLMEVVNNVVILMRSKTNRHMITVQGPSSLEVTVDPLRIEQVLINLLDNAIKYSPDGGPIEVEVALNGEVRLSVTDNGVGIPLEGRENLFTRFYQGHANSSVGGMGLGLYLGKQIIDLHGGRLEAAFPAEGGTCFMISLPLK